VSIMRGAKVAPENAVIPDIVSALICAQVENSIVETAPRGGVVTELT
jgi:hypothetical protein